MTIVAEDAKLGDHARCGQLEYLPSGHGCWAQQALLTESAWCGGSNIACRKGMSREARKSEKGERGAIISWHISE